jgi:hypothetical protein
VLELEGGRWLWWLQKTLWIDLYFSISYSFFSHSFQDNHFIAVFLLVSTYVSSCNLIFN